MNCGGFSFTPIPRVCNFFARTYRSYLEFVALHDPHVHWRAWVLTASCVYIGRERTRSARVPHLISMLRCIEQVFFLLPKVYMPSVLDTSTAPPCMTRTDCAPSQSWLRIIRSSLPTAERQRFAPNRKAGCPGDKPIERGASVSFARACGGFERHNTGCHV